MFVKRKASRPTRERFTEEDDEGEKPGEQDSPSTLASKIKKRSKPKVKSRLSFGGEEEKEDESFKVKRSSLRANLVIGENGVISNASSTSSPLRSSITTSSSTNNQDRPVYSKEYLSELKATTPSGSRLPQTPYDEGDLTMESLEDISVVIDVDQGTLIPTQHSIDAARAKRTQRRLVPDSQQAEEFVSLDVSTHVAGRERESRLVREDDEVGDAEEEMAEYTGATDRIALGQKSRKAEKNRIRMGVVEMIEDAQIDDEDDEGSREWEQEQVRRATAQLERQDLSGASKPQYEPTPIPPPTPLPSLGPAIARLTSVLSTLTTSHSTTTETLAILAAERQSLEEKETGLRKMVGKADAKKTWFEEMTSKTEDLGAFLDVKYPILEEIEKEHLSYIRERREMAARKMLLEDADDLSVFLGVPDVPKQKSNENDAEDDEEEMNGRKEEEMDAGVQRQRFASRQDRYEHKQRSQAMSGIEEDGYESSVPLDPEMESDFQEAVSKLKGRVENMMSDVHAKDYKDPSRGIARWFTDWRNSYGESYRDAWGGLGLVAAWEFWARLESCGWDPFTQPKPLDSFRWFSNLYAHSQNANSAGESTQAEEQDLAGAMVATMFCPRLCAFIENGALNPYSTKQTRRLVEICEEVEVYVPRDDIKYKAILQTVATCYRKAVDETALLVQSGLRSMKPLVRGVSPYPTQQEARKRFVNRRFKLLRNTLVWKRHAGDLSGIGNTVGYLIESSLTVVHGRMDEIEKSTLKSKLKDSVPAELLPAIYK